MRVSSQAAFSAFTCVLAALGSDASCFAGGSLQSECGQQPSDGSQFNGGSNQNDEAVEVPSLMQVNALGGHERFERGDDTVEVIVEIKDAVGQQAVNKFQTPGTSGLFLDANHNLETIIIAQKDLDALQNSAGVQAVEKVVEVKAFVITPQPEAIFEGLGAEEKPYGIAQVQADQLEQGSHSVKVCVVDSGYGLGHPDLPTEATGTNTNVGGKWDVDGHGHGTHCAGSIGAIGGNNVGVTSVNPDPNKFTFHIGKGLSDAGTGSTATVLQAVSGCADAGAKVISLSLGGGGWAQVSADKYKDLYENKGVLIVAAAGNGGISALAYPASYPHVMSVAAVDSNENKAGFSQWNDQVEIAGPGVGVESTITRNNGDSFSYGSFSGTSMATPHVAGVAALVWSHFPQCSNSQIRRILLLTAKDRGDPGCDEKYGWGIVQAKAAYDLLVEKGCDAGGPEMPNETLGGCSDFIGQPPPAPTPMPTYSECLTKVQVKVRTDNYPTENEWFVMDPLHSTVMSGGPYDSPNHLYTSAGCLATGLHTFVIRDLFQDGICNGYGDGSYKVFVNGVEKVNGCEFAYEASHTFYVSSSAPVPTPDSTPPPTPPPTPVPTPDPTPPPTPPQTPVPTPDPSQPPTPPPTPVCDLRPVATGFHCKGTKYLFLGEGMDTCACNKKQRDTCGCSKKSFHWYKNPAFGKGLHACWCPTNAAKDVDAGGVCQGGTEEEPSDPSAEIYYVQNEVCELQPVTTGFYCKGTPYRYLGDGMDACTCNLKQQQQAACSKRSFHWYSAWRRKTGACFCPVDSAKDVNATGFCQGGTTAMTASTAQIFIA